LRRRQLHRSCQQCSARRRQLQPVQRLQRPSRGAPWCRRSPAQSHPWSRVVQRFQPSAQRSQPLRQLVQATWPVLHRYQPLHPWWV